VVPAKEHVADEDADVAGRMPRRVDDPQAVERLLLVEEVVYGHASQPARSKTEGLDQPGVRCRRHAGPPQKGPQSPIEDRPPLIPGHDHAAVERMDTDAGPGCRDEVGQAADVIDVGVRNQDSLELPRGECLAEFAMDRFQPGEDLPR